MNMGKVLTGLFSFAAILTLTGCYQQGMDELRAQNRLQQERISSLENELNQCSVNLEQCRKEKETLAGQTNADLEAKNALISALEADLEKKKALIAQMQAQLLQTGAPLPPELNMRLKEFAKTSDMITFDESTGMLKFKSDLLFDLGSDKVAAGAMDALKQLAAIMKTPEAAAFDMVIVGHTDDVPIKKIQHAAGTSHKLAPVRPSCHLGSECPHKCRHFAGTHGCQGIWRVPSGRTQQT